MSVKNLLILILLGGMLFPTAFAQNGIGFQAIARDNGGVPIANTLIQVRFSIHRNSPVGPLEYQENHSPTTDDFGLFSMDIGTGTPISGTFNSIAWAENTPRYLKVEVDVGAGYLDMGTTELMRVPLAYHSETSDKAVDTYLGELQDVSNASPPTGYSLKWNGSVWAPAQDNDGHWAQVGNDLNYQAGNVSVGASFGPHRLNVQNGRFFSRASYSSSLPQSMIENFDLPPGTIGHFGGRTGLGVLSGSNTSETKYGIQIRSHGDAGQVSGLNSIASGNTNFSMYGVYGRALTNGASTTGSTIAIYGWGDSDGNNSNFGGYFIGNGSNSGVNYGLFAEATGGATNYAGYFDDGNVVIQNRLGIGLTDPLGQLHVRGPIGEEDAITYFTPAGSINDSVTLFFAEDASVAHGMGLRYDGMGNEMEVFGYSNAVTYGPHMIIGRNTGLVTFPVLAGTGTRNLTVDSNGRLVAEPSTNTTQEQVVQGVQFSPQDPSHTAYYISAAIYPNSGNPSSPGYYAPVNLPDGADITQVRVNYYDAVSESIILRLRRATLTSNSTTIMATLSSSGSGGYGSDTETTISNSTIDNDTYQYYLDMTLTNGASWPFPGALGIKTVVIDYTLP